MTKQMSKTQQAAILEAHAYRTEHANGLRDGHVDARGGKGRTARWRMIEAMMTAGHLDRAGRITRAGLVAAGVDMDALHAEALTEDSKRWETAHPKTMEILDQLEAGRVLQAEMNRAHPALSRLEVIQRAGGARGGLRSSR